MQVPTSPRPANDDRPAWAGVTETGAMIAAQLMHAQGRLVKPETSIDQADFSRNLIDLRDPKGGYRGKTPDVSVHSSSLTQGSSPVGGYAAGWSKAERAASIDKSRATTPDDKDIDIMTGEAVTAANTATRRK